MTTPAVSVVLAVHNGQPYIESALRSMMQQTLRDIEIIVVDDASTDDTADVLDRLAREDARIKVLTLPENQGQSIAANLGIDQARAPLIARMDADDLSESTRLEVQAAYMTSHPDVVLLGASVARIDGKGREFHRQSLGRSDAIVRWQSRFFMPLNHPSCMFRKVAQDGTELLYDPDILIAADYDFVTRALACGKVEVLPDVLLRYRLHGGSITSTKRHLQARSARSTARELQLRDLPPDIVDALQPFMDMHYHDANLGADTLPSLSHVFAGFRQMIDYEATKQPAKKAWMKRQAAMLIHLSCQRNKIGRRKTLHAFLTSGRDFIIPRIRYSLARTNPLPRLLQSRSND